MSSNLSIEKPSLLLLDPELFALADDWLVFSFLLFLEGASVSTAPFFRFAGLSLVVVDLLDIF